MRAARTFTDAILVKPQETSFTNLATALAPLLVQEVQGSNAIATPSTIRYQTKSIQVGERIRTQVSYAWDAPQTGGVRITLDARGFPAIWEPATTNADTRVVFVSRALEAAARKQFGDPESGRSFAVERNPTSGSGAMVLRCLDDGPVPMGPMVHVAADDGRISTIICRCMPIQAARLVDTRYYELIPAEEDKRAHSQESDPLDLVRLLRLPDTF